MPIEVDLVLYHCRSWLHTLYRREFFSKDIQSHLASTLPLPCSTLYNNLCKTSPPMLDSFNANITLSEGKGCWLVRYSFQQHWE
jgi:hypothetical protein